VNADDINEQQIQDAVAGHEGRNASLKRLLLEKKVDTDGPRAIDFHFWAASSADAEDLANALRSQGFTILVQRRAATPSASLPWNVEAQAVQSVELTIRRDFTDGLVRLANRHNSRYDGCGTLL
jgi:regulator of ribonuclease activity B